MASIWHAKWLEAQLERPATVNSGGRQSLCVAAPRGNSMAYAFAMAPKSRGRSASKPSGLPLDADIAKPGGSNPRQNHLLDTGRLLRRRAMSVFGRSRSLPLGQKHSLL
jgi:hypothetical protein